MHNPTLIKYFGIKIENIKKYHINLTKRFDIIGTFSEHEINLIATYTGAGPALLTGLGLGTGTGTGPGLGTGHDTESEKNNNVKISLADIQTYMKDGTITLSYGDKLYKLYGKTAKQICSSVKKMTSIKEEPYKKFIKEMTEMIVHRRKHIVYNLYRCMDIMYTNNTIETFSSWSMIPLPPFCENAGIIHLYKLTGGCNGVYIELDTDKPYDYHQYEVILAPGAKFIEYKTETIDNLSNDYIYSKNYNKETDTNIITVHYIRMQ